MRNIISEEKSKVQEKIVSLENDKLGVHINNNQAYNMIIR